MALKIIFMGTPEFSIPTLKKIIDQGHEIVGVYTQPPRPAGRGGKLRKTPVHKYAEQSGLPVFTPKTLKKEEEKQKFAALHADVAVVIAYGLILPKEILSACPHGCLNVHGSLLPRWRGAAPIQRAIMAGDKETGVMIMQMDEGLDTGDILLTETISISANMTAGELHDDMMIKGASLLAQCLEMLQQDMLEGKPQSSSGVTYAEKITKKETKIDWNQHVSDIHNQIRGLSPYPGAWFSAEIDNKEERIKVIKAEIGPSVSQQLVVNKHNILINCDYGSIKLLEVQREGKKKISIKDFINSIRETFKVIIL